VVSFFASTERGVGALRGSFGNLLPFGFFPVFVGVALPLTVHARRVLRRHDVFAHLTEVNLHDVLPGSIAIAIQTALVSADDKKRAVTVFAECSEFRHGLVVKKECWPPVLGVDSLPRSAYGLYCR